MGAKWRTYRFKGKHGKMMSVNAGVPINECVELAEDWGLQRPIEAWQLRSDNSNLDEPGTAAVFVFPVDTTGEEV